MTLAIYKAYSESRKNKHNHLKCENVPKDIKDINAHKANIVMDVILEFLHQGKQPEDEYEDYDDETIIEKCKLIDLVEFCRYNQSNMNAKKI